jgi:hypothetical protein
MKTLPLLAATAMIAMMAAPVFAQTMPMTPSPATETMPANSTTPATTSDAAMPAAASATDAGTPTSATVTTQTVTNGPVPDTPATRAMYKPLSNAGRHTKPAGN